jgi:hypothetical protein
LDPGFGKSKRLPMTSLLGGPGGRGQEFNEMNQDLRVYSPKNPRSRVRVKYIAIIGTRSIDESLVVLGCSSYRQWT